MNEKKQNQLFGGCPNMKTGQGCAGGGCGSHPEVGEWPGALADAPVRAEYFDLARLVVVADREAYSYASFHKELSSGTHILMGCPANEEDEEFAEKLGQILTENDIQSLTAVHMGGPHGEWLEKGAEDALRISGKIIPYEVVVVDMKKRQ